MLRHKSHVMSRSDNALCQMPTVICIASPLKQTITRFMLHYSLALNFVYIDPFVDKLILKLKLRALTRELNVVMISNGDFRNPGAFNVACNNIYS